MRRTRSPRSMVGNWTVAASPLRYPIPRGHARVLRRRLELGGVHVADGDGAAARGLHEALELVDVERGIGLRVEVQRDRREAALDQILVDRIRRAADVRGHTYFLGLEILHQLLVVRRDEVAVVVG